MSQRHSTGKAVLFAFAGRATQALVGILALRTSTTILSVDEIGTLSLLLAAGSWYSLILVNPVGQYIHRHTNEWHQFGQLKSRFTSFGYYLFVAAVVTSFLCAIFSIFSGSPIWLVAAPTLGLFLFSQGWVSTVSASLNLLEFRASSNAALAISSLLGLTFSLLLSSNGNANAVQWQLGQALGFLAVGFVLFPFLHRIDSPNTTDCSIGPISKRDVIKYTAPLIIATAPMWILHEGFRFIVETRLGLHYLGLISVGLLVASRIGGVVESVIVQIYSPQYFQSLANGSRKDHLEAWNRYFMPTSAIYFLNATFVAISAPILIQFFASKEYHAAWWFVAIGAWVQFFRSQSNLISTIAHGIKNTSELYFPYFFGAGITTALVYLATGIGHSALLVPLSLLVGNVATSILLSKNLFKHMQTKIPLAQYALSVIAAPVFAAPYIFVIPGQSIPMKTAVLTTLYLGAVYFFISLAIHHSLKQRLKSG